MLRGRRPHAARTCSAWCWRSTRPSRWPRARAGSGAAPRSATASRSSSSRRATRRRSPTSRPPTAWPPASRPAPRASRLAVAVMLGAQEPRLRPLAGPGDGSSQPSRLDPATVVALRLSADPAVALRLAAEQRGLAAHRAGRRHGGAAGHARSRWGPGWRPKADLDALLGGRALAQPLRVARLEALAGLKDPAAFTAACDQLMALLGARPARGRWTMGGGDAEVAWAVQGQTVALSAGAAGGLPPLLARLQAGGRGFEPPAGDGRGAGRRAGRPGAPRRQPGGGAAGAPAVGLRRRPRRRGGPLAGGEADRAPSARGRRWPCGPTCRPVRSSSRST